MAERLEHVEGHCSSLEREIAGGGSGEIRTLSEAMGRVKEDITELKSLKRRMELVEGAPPAQRVRTEASASASTDFDAEAWSSANVVAGLLRRKMANLNEQQYVNKDNVYKLYLFTAPLTICVGCYRAGLDPDCCIWLAGLRGYQQHCRKPSCAAPLQVAGTAIYASKSKKRPGTQEQKTFVEKECVEGPAGDYIYLRCPGFLLEVVYNCR
ncbi:hypothetical protein B484DRAFT_398844 [Ochromonadaceae sp. CCMP2298]|nr:hypothetical protein B484DRAFT_398844 [Ochromonadaceae sp. CCMP2298]